jgi:hypothetical protein
MRPYLIIAALGSLLCMPAAAQRSTPEEQKQTLDTAREIAIHYTSKLPDFICTEQVERSDRISQTNMKVDRLTIQLTYFGQKEKQKLVAMNGQNAAASRIAGRTHHGRRISAAFCWGSSIRRRPPIFSGRNRPPFVSVMLPCTLTASRAPIRIT